VVVKWQEMLLAMANVLEKYGTEKKNQGCKALKHSFLTYSYTILEHLITT